MSHFRENSLKNVQKSPDVEVGLFRGEQKGESAKEGAADGEGDDEGVGGAVDLLQHRDHDAEREQAARREDSVEDLGPLGKFVGVVQVELIPSSVKTRGECCVNVLE